jgi:hypothetical protein
LAGRTRRRQGTTNTQRQRNENGARQTDAWVPKFGYAMLKDYEKIDSAIIAADAHIASIHAIDLADWLEVAYPSSEFAPK